MDHGRFQRCVGSRKKVHSRCQLLLLLVTVLVSPAFAQTRVVSLSTQFDGFLQAEFFDLNGVALNGQTLSVDFRFQSGPVLESVAPVWAELMLQTRPHGPDGDYPYDQYVVFGPGTTAYLLGSSGQRLDVPMSDWNGALTMSPAPTLAVLSTPRGLAGGDLLAYPSYGEEIGGIHYDIVLPNTGETLFLGRIALKLETRWRRIPVTQTIPPDVVPEPPPTPPPPPPAPAPAPPSPDPGVPVVASSPATNFAVSDLGTASFTASRNGPLVGGYGRIQPDAGSTSPSGMLIIGSRSAGVLTGETIVPDSPLMTSGRIYAELTPDGRVTTGIAFSNPNNQDVTINFEMRNEQGSIYRTGSFTLRGAGAVCDPDSDCNQLERRLDEAPYFSGADVKGTLTFSSTIPVAVFGIRWTSTVSSGGERLMVPVPVIDLSNGPNYGVQAVPLFAVGLGRTSELVLVNPTGSTLTGTVQFLDPYGVPVLVSLGSAYTWNAPYSMAPNSSQKLVMTDVIGGYGYGSVRMVPDAGSPVPSAFVNYNYVQDGLMTFEVAVPVTMGAAFRMPVEQSPSRQISTSLSIANPSGSGGNVWFSLTASDGSFIASTSRYISDAGLLLEYLESLLPVANQEIEGVLRITTDLPGGISVAGYRARYNERQQLLYTTVVPALENGLPSSDARFFPYLLNGSGFTTGIIIFSGKAGQSSAGSLRFMKPDATPLDLGITPVPK